MILLSFKKSILRHPHFVPTSAKCILHKELEGRLNEMGCDQFKYSI
jgi:hypothetical protein